MNRRRVIMITAIAAVLIMMTALSSCSQITGGAGKASENIKVVYEGYEAADSSLEKPDGTLVECRTYCFIFENVSDKDLKKAGVHVSGLNESGEQLASEYGGSYQLPSLRPGERSAVEVLEAEWTEFPASFSADVSGAVWGESKRPRLSVTDVKYGEYGFTCDVTIKNDSDEDFVWVNEASDEDLSDVKWIPSLKAVDKDEDGNVRSIDTGILMDGDDLSHESISFAPGEEKTLSFCFTESYQEPEVMICWR